MIVSAATVTSAMQTGGNPVEDGRIVTGISNRMVNMDKGGRCITACLAADFNPE